MFSLAPVPDGAGSCGDRRLDVADILIVDDERRMGDLLREEMEEAGFQVHVESSGATALERLRSHRYRLVLTDLRMTAPDGMEILRAAKRLSPVTDVIMMTAYASYQTGVEAMKLGASDYIMKPFDMEELLQRVRRVFDKQQLTAENSTLHAQIAGTRRPGMIGDGSAMRELRHLITLVAASDATVLVRGPSGSGKEIVAGEIHAQSPRAAAPFVAVNCAAIPDTLLESELFGHEKGAFTGADARRAGRFELAQGGTIFLDEIGEMGAGVQSKLLRVLEDRRIMRLGGSDAIEVDLRVVAATNRNLQDMIRDGRFREDLFYRLNVFPIEVPALAARREDVPALAEYFLRELRHPLPQLGADAMAVLQSHDWPGNVRELRNLIERATILAQGSPIRATHLSLPQATPNASGMASLEMDLPDGGIDLEKLEAHLIRRALVKAEGNKSQAARLLGMTRRTLYSRMEKHGIQE